MMMKVCVRSLGVASALAGILLGGTVLAQAPAIKIGVNFERTGPAASYGQHALVSAQIAVDEINKAGGVNGSPLELVVEDNKSSPEQAVIVTRNLADKGAFVMLGPVITTVVRTAFPATNRAEMPAMSPGSGAPGIGAQNRPWGFRNAAIDQLIIGDVVAAIRSAYPNARNVVAIIDPKDPYNNFLVKSVAPEALTKNGFTVVNKDALVEIPVDVTDFSVFVTRVKALNPDVILVGTLHEALAGFLKEANRQKLNVPMFSGLGSITDSVADAAQSIHVFSGQPFDPASDDPKVKAFAAEFRSRAAKELPGQYTNPIYADAGTYEAINMFAEALRDAKMTGATPVKEARTRIRDFLTGLKAYQGLGNVLEINKDGDAVKKTIVFDSSGGGWKRI